MRQQRFPWDLPYRRRRPDMELSGFTAGGCRGADFFFTDANHGLLVFKEGKTYLTNDGNNWTVMLATTLGRQIRFADSEVGWTIWSSPSNWRAARISDTTDGGLHW